MDYDWDEDELDDEVEEESNSLEEEAGYVCNSCGEEIVVPLDHSQGQQQEYVEDCPVCCNPNVIFVEFDPEGVPNVWSKAEQDLN
ncbi:MAG: rubrerythrin [Mariniblastus sp.]